MDENQKAMTLLKDSSGRESRTLTMVVIAYCVLLVKFGLAGLDLPVIGQLPNMTAGEFGTAVMTILAPWVGREFVKK